MYLRQEYDTEKRSCFNMMTNIVRYADHRKSQQYRACKLGLYIRLYATLCFNYFRWHRNMFSYGSVFELLIW